MVYAEAVEHLYALGPELASTTAASSGVSKPARKFDLAHMRALCAALGEPQVSFPSVLIAGTNGKGSTAATLASILTAAGYRTGLYTSPHLVQVNERVQIAESAESLEDRGAGTRGDKANLRLATISDADFARIYTRVDEACDLLVSGGAVPMLPSFFERLTAVAFLFFAERQAEIVVLEVGLGGRLDATNVVEPLLSVITDIALDHQEYLGETIAEIASEKCGILRSRGSLITLPQLPEANTAIGRAAVLLDVRAINAADYLPSPRRDNGLNGPDPWASPWRNQYVLQLANGSDRSELAVDSPLAGVHQQRNIALAIAAAIDLRNNGKRTSTLTSNNSGYEMTNEAIERGICNTRWPGRLEIVGNVLLDVAHNPAGAWTLRAALSALPERIPRTLIFSCLRDKNLAEMSRILFPLFDRESGDPMRHGDAIVLTAIDSPRAAALEDLATAAQALGVRCHTEPHPEAALAQARRITPSDGMIVATGSVYLAGELRRLLMDEGG